MKPFLKNAIVSFALSMIPALRRGFFPLAHALLLAMPLVILPTSKAQAGFIYSPIVDTVISASFNADFAALVAHRYVAGEEVNALQLTGANGDVLDLTNAFFGNSELLFGDTPQINQGSLDTQIFSVGIAPSFFSALMSGHVGLFFLATDTDDGLFAMDYLSLKITTASGVIEAFIDSNDGYKIGLADNVGLPAALPLSIQIGATGVGFDESISSKSLLNVVREPTTLSLILLAGAMFGVSCQLRSREGNHDDA